MISLGKISLVFGLGGEDFRYVCVNIMAINVEQDNFNRTFTLNNFKMNTINIQTKFVDFIFGFILNLKCDTITNTKQ